MEFGKRHDTADTMDFCPRQLVRDFLRGNWCNIRRTPFFLKTSVGQREINPIWGDSPPNSFWRCPCACQIGVVAPWTCIMWSHRPGVLHGGLEGLIMSSRWTGRRS